MIQVYGEDYFRKTWSEWIDAMLRLYKKQNGDLCKQVLSKIKCPTLIIHGAKDAMVLPEHPTYLKQNIANSKFVSPYRFEKIKITYETCLLLIEFFLYYSVHIFEKGGHNLHLRYFEEFNNLVTDFLLTPSKI